MEKCRFLSEKDVCQVGQLAQHNLVHKESITAVLTGDVDKPSLANLNCVRITDKDSGREVIIFVMDCTAASDVAKQQDCDTFVSKKKPDRQKWIENFSEG